MAQPTASLKVKRVLLTSLTEDPHNARKHNQRNLDAIKASLEQHSQVEPLVVQKSSSKVIGGNGRLAAMRAMGWTHADVVELNVEDKQAAALGIQLNRTAELAEWDDEQLAETLKQFQEEGINSIDVGFDDDELRKVLVKEHERTIGGTDENKTPEERVKKRDSIARGKRVFDVTCGDSLVVLASMPENSVDAVVCDPPYEINFMARKWDGSGIAFSVDLWKQVFRVLKPGGNLLAFGGTRTYHRMTCAIEDAGFEIRDCLAWLYGSGFPKSLNVAKAVEAHALTGGSSPKDLADAVDMTGQGLPSESLGLKWDHEDGTRQGISRHAPGNWSPTTGEAKRWDGWGTALKPAHEPVVMARKPLSEPTIAANVLKWGTGALNIRGARIGDDVRWSALDGADADDAVGFIPSRPDYGGREVVGRWPANLLLDEQAAKMLDAQSGVSVSTETTVSNKGSIWGSGNEEDRAAGHNDSSGASRFFFVSRELDQRGHATRFSYVAKPSRAERDAGLESMPTVNAASVTGRVEGSKGQENGMSGMHGMVKNIHPTVKPADLMHHLCVMVCPPGGLIVDPFCGSGSTGIGAVLGNFRFSGIELDPVHTEIALKRIRWWASQYE